MRNIFSLKILNACAFALISLFSGQPSHSQTADQQNEQVPVEVAFRESKVKSSLTVQFTNKTTTKHLAIQITSKSKTFGTTKVKALHLNPGESKTLGWLQGLPISSGDSITVSEGNYASKTIVAP